MLRSGARYGKWRCNIERMAAIEQIELLDQFDEHTDVHVFILVLNKREEPARPFLKCYDRLRQPSGWMDESAVVTLPSVP